jgi:hypothetical protein
MPTLVMHSQLRKTALQGKYFVAITLAILAGLSYILIAPQRAAAQAQNTGSIYGSAVDPSGAVIQGATISAVSAANGSERTITTNKNGEYTLENLAIGKYTLTVTAPGFEAYVVNNIMVDADSNTKIVAKLVIGSTDTVTVQEESSAVDARSATLGSLLDNKLVEDIPIDGRNVVAMAGLLPGVSEVNAPTSATGDTNGPTYAAGGSRDTQNLLLFDGLMWNNLFYNTGVNYPPPNALQEVSILLNNYKAQYGRNAGSVFNVLTHSGSNVIHGAVWDYLHNQLFDAQDYLNPLPWRKAPEDNINQFGFTIGGPIKHDKLFYFGAFQQLIAKLQNVSFAQSQGLNERGFQNNDAASIVNTALTQSPAYDHPCTSPGPFAGMMCASFSNDVTTTQTAAAAGGGLAAGQSVPVLGKLGNPSQVSGSTSGADANTAISNLNTAWQESNPAHASQTSPCIDYFNGPAVNWAGSHYYQDGQIAFPLPSGTSYTQAGGPAYFDQANPVPGITYDKVQSTYLPFAEFPAICINPVVGAMLAKYVPMPNYTRNGRTYSIAAAPQPKNDTNVLVRLDYILSTKHTLDMRYNLIRGNDMTAPGVNSASVGIANYEVDYNTVVSNFGNIGDTWVISPNTVNVFRAGYKRYENVTNPTDPSTYDTFNSANSTINGHLLEPGKKVLPVLSFGSSYFSLGAAGASGGNANQAFSDHINEDIDLLDQLTWSHGKHNYQFGAEFMRLQYLNNQDYPGMLSFGSSYTSLNLADGMLGFPSSVTANSPLVQGGVQHDIFFFAQDDWRATTKLTINLGVRYELPFQWYQPNGYSSTFIPGFQSTVFPGAIGGLAFPGDPGVRSSLVPTDFNGLVPRVGFAYDVFGTGRLALRGGFGMFSDQINANVIGVGQPFYYQTYTIFPAGGASDPLLKSDGTRITLPSGYDKTNPVFQYPFSLFFPDRNFRTPYVMAANLGFQYKVPHGGTLEANYVGKFSRKLTIPFDLNPAITQCSGGYYNANPSLYGNSSCQILAGTANGNANSGQSSTRQRLRYTQFNNGGNGLVDFASIGTASYSSLQVQYTQRGGKRLTLLVSYTYGKSIDEQTNAKTVNNAIPDVFNVASERGLADNDARHILNMGWTYNLPSLRYGYAPLRAVVNNWNFSGIYSARTGNPFSVYINSDVALDGEPNQRAAIVPGMNPNLPSNRHRSQKVAQWFNPAAFTYPLTGTFSSVPRNAFEGPAYINTNFELGRFFPLENIRKDMKLQARVEALNVFNTPNLKNPPSATFSCSNSNISVSGPAACTGTSNGTPNTIATGGTFGQILSTYGTNGTTSSNGRKMQFSLTLYY